MDNQNYKPYRTRSIQKNIWFVPGQKSESLYAHYAEIRATIARVSESKTQTIERLHEELAVLYRNGGYEKQLIATYWGRIERLEAEAQRAKVRRDERIEDE